MTENGDDTVDELLEAIYALSKANNLAAVVVHMNDTYLIEEQCLNNKLYLPGLARVATLTGRIREAVQKETGEDRTLVVHSGDYLSPSYLSNKCGTQGRHMVELLGLCGVSYATLGNHEFDHEAPGSASVLLSILRSRATKFRTVATNLAPPRRSGRVERIVLWPDENPFIAILGLAGEETIKVAGEHGFRSEEVKPALKSALDNIKCDPRIRCLVILSHLSRSEDKALQVFLDEEWQPHGFAYVLGGHDHHIDWQERGRCVSLSKNLSNCASLTVVLITKTFAAAPPKYWGDPPPRYLTPEEAIAALKEVEADPRLNTLFWGSSNSEAGYKAFAEARRQLDRENARKRDEALQRALPAIVEEAIHFYRNRANAYTRADFIDAYCKYIRQTAENFPSYAADGPRALHAQARYLVGSEFHDGTAERDGKILSDNWIQLFRIVSSTALGAVEPCPAAQERIKDWLAENQKKIGTNTAKIIADFSKVKKKHTSFVCLDRELRTKSTNFGNFIADAVEIAAKVDVAFIHAGSFRSDCALDMRLSLAELHETFIYDHPEAIALVELSGNEIEAAIEHACRKPGSSRFLQVSRGLDGVRQSGRKDIHVAIPTYLIVNDQDGYQSLLTASRSCVPEIRESHSLIDLVLSAANEVAYDETIRLRAIAALTSEDQWIRKFIKLMDTLINALPKARRANIRELLTAPKGYMYEWDEIGIRGQSLRKLLLNLYIHVDKLLEPAEWVYSPWPPDRVRETYRKIANDEVVHIRKLSYHDYFDDSAGYVYWWRTQHHAAEVRARVAPEPVRKK